MKIWNTKLEDFIDDFLNAQEVKRNRCFQATCLRATGCA